MVLNERNKRVLHAIVESFIERPVPVGSRHISKSYDFNLSSASIRNIMADLEELGYLSQPHTSAGRVPTDKGYRYYVDALAEEGYRLDDDALAAVLKECVAGLHDDIYRLLNAITEQVSDMSSCLAFAVPLRADNTTLNRVQLYRYRGTKTVAVLMTNEGLVTSKVLGSDFGFSQKDLDRISDYLNSEFSGQTIDGIRSLMVAQMSREKKLVDAMISKAMRICREAFVFPGYDIIFSGVSGLIGLPEFADKVKSVALAVEDKRKIISILDGLRGGVQVLIGRENPDRGFRDLSIVTAEYCRGDVPLGRVGMIGPTRMDYSRAIPMVEVMARCISSSI